MDLDQRTQPISSFSWPCEPTDTNLHPRPNITVFLLGDEVVLGFEIGFEGVDVLALVLLDISGHSLQDVIRGGRAAARAALWAAGF